MLRNTKLALRAQTPRSNTGTLSETKYHGKVTLAKLSLNRITLGHSSGLISVFRWGFSSSKQQNDADSNQEKKRLPRVKKRSTAAVRKAGSHRRWRRDLQARCNDYEYDYDEFRNLYFPFFKNLMINLGWFFIPFSIFVIVGSSNAVNLTDGLDGLATVPVILVAGCFAFISYVSGNIIFAEYLLIPYIEGVGDVAVFCGAVIGASIGFLWFNAPPAKIFMGDTGSLALGGSLGAVGVVTKHEIVLAITGGLFVLEAVSVIVQVASFKLTGKRIFKMAPIHHHFEKKGWPESTVVIRFWIISLILAMIGLATLKLR